MTYLKKREKPSKKEGIKGQNLFKKTCSKFKNSLKIAKSQQLLTHHRKQLLPNH